jgi:tetratricopeptide (TPR) repeat protein
MEEEPAAYYNLGLGYEIQGLLDEAEQYYQFAVRIDQKQLYMEAIARVRQSREEQEKLIQQLEEEADDEIMSDEILF